MELVSLIRQIRTAEPEEAIEKAKKSYQSCKNAINEFYSWQGKKKAVDGVFETYYNGDVELFEEFYHYNPTEVLPKYTESAQRTFECAKQAKQDAVVAKWSTKLQNSFWGRNAEIDELMSEAQSGYKAAKNGYRSVFGTPVGMKILKAGAIGASIGLVLWGAFKAYNYMFKPADYSNIKYPENTLKSSDMVQEMQEQKAVVPESVKETETQQADTVMNVQEQSVQPPEVQKTAVESTQLTEQEPVIEVNKEEQSGKTLTREEKLAAFNRAIDKMKATLSTEGIECDSYTTVKKDTLWKIAAKTLQKEGITNPTPQDTTKRIALIALLNEIEDVNKLSVNQVIKIPSAELNAYIESNEEYSRLLSELAELFT